MATKSILKDVKITNKYKAKSFLSALENSRKKSSKQVSFNRGYSEIKKDDLKNFFKDIL